jgi:hypothetical protein
MTEFSFYKLSRKLYFWNLLEKILRFQNDSKYAGVQSKNNEYHIVNKVDYIFNVVGNVVFVVLGLYASMYVYKFLIIFIFHSKTLCNLFSILFLHDEPQKSQKNKI